jgi:transposase
MRSVCVIARVLPSSMFTRLGRSNRWRFVGSGGTWSSRGSGKKAGLHEVLRSILKERRYEFDVERAIYLTVLQRLFASGSDGAAERWREDYPIPGTEGLELHDLYGAMAFLAEVIEELGKPTGAVRCTKDLGRREFLDFMNELEAKNPEQEIHVVLDNLNTHKPKEDRWLKAHPQVHFHFIPTRSCWLNQVECWFSILSRGTLQGASFTSVKMLIEAIETFVANWNQHATPFEWIKEEVQQQQMKHSYSNLRN